MNGRKQAKEMWRKRKDKWKCTYCEKKAGYDQKFRLRNFPLCWALACKNCGQMLYY